MRVAATGNEIVSQAMKQIHPAVVAAYPITPQTDIVEEYSKYVANGDVDTELVLVESEHSSMSVCVGAAAAGGRTMTATSSQGLAYMWEVLPIASGLRLPIVMAVTNRALSAPINIHCDHSDAMGARDSGWIQLYCRTAQEAYDSMIQAVRIAEDPAVRLPVMVNYDGFITSHALVDVEKLDDEKVNEFIGDYIPNFPLLDVDHPVTYGSLDLFDFYMEHKRQQAQAMLDAPRVIKDVGREFGEKFGRKYGLVNTYKLEDAELGIVALNSTAMTAEVAADEAREAGLKAGVLSIRSFRPFPKEKLVDKLRNLKAICVLDRADSFGGMGGPVGFEVRSALFDEGVKDVKVINWIYGLGGRDVSPADLSTVYATLADVARTGILDREYGYLGVRVD